MKIIYLLVLVFYVTLVSTQKTRCQLSWEIHNSGQKFSTQSVKSDSKDSIYIIRSKFDSSNKYDIGYALTNGLGYFVHLNEGKTSHSYEVLENKNGCELTWVRPSHSDVEDFNVPASNSDISNSYIGRGQLSEYSMASGTVDGTNKILQVLDKESILKLDEDKYAVLTSILSPSKGLELELKNFVMDSTMDNPKYEMLGIDEIYNDANVLVSQTITHTKKVKQEVELQTSVSWGGSMYVKVELCILFLCVDGKVEISQKNEQSSTLTKTTEEVLSLSRTIDLPPFVSVQACSIISKQENITKSWEATAEFRYVGLNGNQVADLVKKDIKWKDVEFDLITENTASAQISGSFRGNLQTTTVFFVSSAGSQGCTTLQKIFKENQNGSSLDLQDLKKMLDFQ